MLACTLPWTTALAQNSGGQDLAALEQTAHDRNAAWEALAKDLGERVARILPCDRRSTEAITEVSRASEARMAALNDYLKAASAQAFTETAAARILLSAEEQRAADAGRERTDARQEQAEAATQAQTLSESAGQRASLQDSQKLLAQIAVLIGQRSTAAEQRAGAADRAVTALRVLVAKLEDRDAALRDESVAFEAERTRWSGYYTARLARAQVECSITQIGPAPTPAKSKGKAQVKGKQ